MKVKLKFNKELQLSTDNNDVVLNFEEEKKYRDYIFLAKKEYDRLKAEIFNKFINEYKGDFETFAEFINVWYNSVEAEVIESTFDDKLLPFHLISNSISIDGIITSYGIMIDPNVVYCDMNNLYNVNVKENTIQVEF